jgi:hypothetical protein
MRGGRKSLRVTAGKLSESGTHAGREKAVFPMMHERPGIGLRLNLHTSSVQISRARTVARIANH